MKWCKYCLHSRVIVSENGTHYSCTLPDKQARKCLLGEKDMMVRIGVCEEDDHATD